uniref:Beta-galactoside alpha--sialyltransferase 1 isoform x1 n=2 Tax=Tetraselmis sp. GSL018 TaxID=582737 RepID=A0A061QMP4_9CHLO
MRWQRISQRQQQRRWPRVQPIHFIGIFLLCYSAFTFLRFPSLNFDEDLPDYDGVWEDDTSALADDQHKPPGAAPGEAVGKGLEGAGSAYHDNKRRARSGWAGEGKADAIDAEWEGDDPAVLGDSSGDGRLSAWAGASGPPPSPTPDPYRARQKELERTRALQQKQEPFAPHVASVVPSHGPRSGGTVLLIRGSGFGSITDEITVTIGGVPCEETRRLSSEAVSCLTPAGQGTDLPVRVERCTCSAQQQGNASAAAAHMEGEFVFSYDEDALKGIITQDPPMKIRPKKINIQMNRQQLGNATDLSFEAEFFDYRLGATNFYSMMPAMIQVLPVADINQKFESCAVVGRGASLLGSRLGPTIDRHHAVFRFDNSPTALKYASDVGRRTRYQVLSPHWANNLLSYGAYPEDPSLPRVTRWWIDVASVVLWGDISQSAYLKLRYIYPGASVVFLSRDLTTMVEAIVSNMRARIEKVLHISLPSNTAPSSQMYTLLMAVNMCNKVRVFGVDSGCTIRSRRCMYTYFDESEPSERAMRQLVLESNIIVALHEAGLLEHVRGPRQMSMGVTDVVVASGGALPRCDSAMCTPPCSGNGRFFNGTCHCRRMFSGASCEHDHLRLNAEALLKGIDLTYKGAILMNQQSVRWLPQDNKSAPSALWELGLIELPPGLANNKTEVGDNYVIDRRTYNLLPETDDALFENWVRTRPLRDPEFDRRLTLRKPGLGTCALVGNSGTLLSHQYGAAIDDHDVVYRFNQAPLFGFKGEVGARCTHESLNSAWVKLLVEGKHGEGVFGQHRNWDWRADDTALVLFELFDPTSYQQKGKDSILTKEQWWKKMFQKLKTRHPDRKVFVMSPKFVGWAYKLYKEFEDRFESLGFGNFRGEKPMSGYYAVMYALQVCSEVDIYGFTPYQESDAGDPLAPRYHYFDEAVPRHNSHSFDLTQNVYRLLASQLPYFRIYD